MAIRPLADRVLIEVEKAAEETTASGLVLASKKTTGPVKAKVIAAGEGKYTSGGALIALQVKAGDTVLVASSAGTKLKDNDKEYVLVYESEILAIVD